MRTLYSELLGPGRVDPALGIGGANKGTWFGNILTQRSGDACSLRSARAR